MYLNMIISHCNPNYRQIYCFLHQRYYYYIHKLQNKKSKILLAECIDIMHIIIYKFKILVQHWNHTFIYTSNNRIFWCIARSENSPQSVNLPKNCCFDIRYLAPVFTPRVPHRSVIDSQHYRVWGMCVVAIQH